MSKPPNFLLLLPDQHRSDWLGDNPALPLRTPNIDALAARGVTFDRGYCPSPLCAPCRASLASGRDYERCGVPNNHVDYPLDQPTYYQALRDVGYRVAGVGKLDLHKDTSDPAKLDWHLDGSRYLKEWGFTDGMDNEGKLDGSTSYKTAGEPPGPYLHFLQQRGLAEQYVREHEQRHAHRNAYVTALPNDAYCDNWIAENGLRILRRLPANQPWHLVVNFTGPHDPMDVTASMAERWRDTTFPPPRGEMSRDLSDEDHQRNRRHYAAMIENIDRHVGRFIEAVRERGELDNTYIIYASDHGEMLGDHQRWGKSVYYESSVRVPLIVTGPDVQRGVRRDTLVCLHDLSATFLDAASASSLSEMEARSLLPVCRGEKRTHWDHMITALRPWRAVIEAQYKLVLGQEKSPILHDLQADPWEDCNVAAQQPAVVQRLSELLMDRDQRGVEV
ncbi:MAG: sulfatase [Phycisphaeraceae bacterium]